MHCSLKTLKKQLTEAKAAAAKQSAPEGQQPSEGEVPLEWGRILTEEDFERIRYNRVGVLAAVYCSDITGAAQPKPDAHYCCRISVCWTKLMSFGLCGVCSGTLNCICNVLMSCGVLLSHCGALFVRG